MVEAFLALALFIAQLDDVAGAEVIADEKIQVVLILPRLAEEPGRDEETGRDLVMQGRFIGDSVEDLGPGPVDGLTDPVSRTPIRNCSGAAMSAGPPRRSPCPE